MALKPNSRSMFVAWNPKLQPNVIWVPTLESDFLKQHLRDTRQLLVLLFCSSEIYQSLDVHFRNLHPYGSRVTSVLHACMDTLRRGVQWMGGAADWGSIT